MKGVLVNKCVETSYILKYPHPDNADQTMQVAVYFRDGIFQRCVFPYAGHYTYNMWKLLGSLSQHIQELQAQEAQ